MDDLTKEQMPETIAIDCPSCNDDVYLSRDRNFTFVLYDGDCVNCGINARLMVKGEDDDD